MSVPPGTVARVRHAMTAEFRALVALPDPARARAAAEAALALLPGLEEALTRHVAHADLARLEHAPAGVPFPLNPDLFDCLAEALRWREATRGAFDPAWRCADRVREHGAPVPFTLDPGRLTLVPAIDRLQLDLGAIGKGFALDRLAELLRMWDAPAFCLIAGSGSSVLAGEPPPDAAGWPVGLGGRTLHLARRAVGASGTGWRGMHLHDPAAGAPAAAAGTTWALAGSAAAADALSTAFHVLGSGAGALASRIPDVCLIRERDDGTLLVHGDAELG